MSRSPGSGFSGDAEDGETLIDKVADQGIVGRQIKNVVFHDPCRNDQDRFRMDHFRGGLVLDELDQPVPEHDLARRGGDVLSYDKILRPGRG